MFDVLASFAQWWLATRTLAPPSDGFLTRAGSNTGVVLYRQSPFQVQLFLNDPNSEIVDHLHPNVDSFEVYVAGDVFFRMNGQALITADQPAPFGKSIRVLPSDWHGASIGPKGGAFLSIQHWLNGVAPSSVELDWAGPALDRQHADKLNPRAAEDADLDDGA